MYGIYLFLIFFILIILTLIFLFKINNTKKRIVYRNHVIRYATELEKNQKIINIQNRIILQKRLKLLFEKHKGGN